MRIQRIVVTGMFLSGCLLGSAVAAEQQAQGQAVEAKVSSVQKKEISKVEKTQSVVEGNAIDPAAISDVQKDDGFVSSSKRTRDAIEQYRQKKGIEFGVENAKGQIFYSAIETVSVDETNPQWAKWRVVAYKKAYMKIKQDFIESIYGKIVGSTLQEYFNDDSDNRLDFPVPGDPRALTKTGEVWDKLLALTGAKLDRALEDLGIDPAQYKAAPPEQRKTLFKNNLIEKSVVKAAGSLGGLIPIKTFEGFDSKGNYTIGVIAMYYGKLKQLAYDIVKKREPMLTKKGGNPMATYIPKTKKELARAFGVRLAFDETGEPAIISYGQWSYLYKGKNQKKLDRSYEFAEKKAKAESQKQIAQFLNSSAFYKKMEETSALEEDEAIMDRDGNVREEDTATMIDRLQSSMKVRFSADLRGMKTYKRWSYKYPNGHEIVGVVTVWTQKNAEGVDKIRNWKPGRKKIQAHQNVLKKTTGASGVREGVGMDTDF